MQARYLLPMIAAAAFAAYAWWAPSGAPKAQSPTPPDSARVAAGSPTEPEQPLPATALTHRPTAAIVSRRIAQPANPAAAQATRGGDGRTVEFEVVEDDLAVAYGDIILGKIEAGSAQRRGRYEPQAVRTWESPEIPYAINPDLPNPERVQKALDYFAQNTPVSFVARTTQEDALVFEPGKEHCYSSLGKTGGLQPVKLSTGCGPQEIMHEIMHALGFVHEQSRPDRDTYVVIGWDNIETKYWPQFETVPEVLMDAMRGTAFDYRSIMLYKPDAFATKPGLKTLEPRPGRPAVEPVAQGLSEGDIQRLKRMYRL